MKKFVLLLTLYLNLFTAAARATDLLDVYWQASHNDPTYRAAKQHFYANREIINQANAGLWPRLVASADKTIYNQTRNDSITPSATTETLARNKPRTISVSLVQSLFSVETYAKIKQANASVRQAVADYQTASQDLMLRVANQYLDVLQMQDTLAYTRAEKKAIARQLDQAKQRYKVGLNAITSVYDVRASYDAVVAREIRARNDLSNRLEILAETSGQIYPRLTSIRENLALQYPKPARVQNWVQSALRQNARLRSARANSEQAQSQIRVAQSAMMPTLSLRANYLNSVNNNFGGLGLLNTRTREIHLHLDVPIFQGGRLWSVNKQAKHLYQAAMAHHDATAKATVSLTRQSYNSTISGISAVKADRQAIKSAKSALASTQAAFKAGSRTMVDVLDKQRALFEVKRRLAADQYNTIKQILRLKQASGTLSVKDLEQVNAWLTGPTAHTTLKRFLKKNQTS